MKETFKANNTISILGMSSVATIFRQKKCGRTTFFPMKNCNGYYKYPIMGDWFAIEGVITSRYELPLIIKRG